MFSVLTNDERYSHISFLVKIIANRFSARLCRGEGIPAAQRRILGYLGRRGCVRANDLAKRFRIAPATISGIVSRMERDGYVRQEENPADRRSKIIRLTEKGRRAVGSIARENERQEEMLLEGFSMEERERLHGYLERMIRNLDKGDCA